MFSGENHRFLRAVATALSSVALTLTVWFCLMALLESPFTEYRILWAGTLWVSSIFCSGLVAHSSIAVRPVLACTIAFGVFGLIYVVLEGWILDYATVSSESGMPFLVWNLACLPAGVFAAAETGARLGKRFRVSRQNRPTQRRAVRKDH